MAGDIGNHGSNIGGYGGLGTGGGPGATGGLGFGISAGANAGIGIGSMMGGFNGPGRAVSGEIGPFSGSYDWNDNYHGISGGFAPLDPTIIGVYYNKTHTSVTKYN